MTLEELLKTFVASDPEDWRSFSCGGHGEGSSYRDRFSFWQTYNGNQDVIVHDSFGNVATYKPDLSITIAWGMPTTREDEERVNEAWATMFPNSSPGLRRFIDFFYNNALVFRYTYVSVDGGRCFLKYPHIRQDGSYYFTREECDFLRQLNRVTGSNSFDYYFGQTGIDVVDEPWDY